MIHPEEKRHFTVLATLYALVWAGLLLAHLNVPFKEFQGPLGLVGLFALPLMAPFSALIIFVVIADLMAEVTKSQGWLLARSYWGKQIFAVLPILNGLALYYLNAGA